MGKKREPGGNKEKDLRKKERDLGKIETDTELEKIERGRETWET